MEVCNFTHFGASWVWLSPCPRRPYSPRPHVYSWPDEVTAALWLLPAATSRIRSPFDLKWVDEILPYNDRIRLNYRSGLRYTAAFPMTWHLRGLVSRRLPRPKKRPDRRPSEPKHVVHRNARPLYEPRIATKRISGVGCWRSSNDLIPTGRCCLLRKRRPFNTIINFNRLENFKIK